MIFKNRYESFLTWNISGPDNSSKPLCLGCMTRKVSGNYLCRDCNWPLCSNICAKSPNHIEECKLLKSRGAKIKIPWFDKPCSYYDAILPLRVMLLKKTNPRAYNLISILMDHAAGMWSFSIMNSVQKYGFLFIVILTFYTIYQSQLYFSRFR